MRDGGIQHSGSRPSASSCRRCRASVLSVLGVPLTGRRAEGGVGRLGDVRRDAWPRPAPPRHTATPVHPSSANATSSRPANRRSQARRCARSSRGHLAALGPPPVHGVEIVEGELLSGGYRARLRWASGPPQAPQGRTSALPRGLLTRSIVTRPELGRSSPARVAATRKAQPLTTSAGADACHLFSRQGRRSGDVPAARIRVSTLGHMRLDQSCAQ